MSTVNTQGKDSKAAATQEKESDKIGLNDDETFVATIAFVVLLLILF